MIGDRMPGTFEQCPPPLNTWSTQFWETIYRHICLIKQTFMLDPKVLALSKKPPSQEGSTKSTIPELLKLRQEDQELKDRLV